MTSATHTKLSLRILVAACVFGPLLSQAQASPPLAHVDAENVGFDSEKLAEIDRIVEQGIADGEMPGAVVLVARQGGIAYFKAFGDRAVEPQREPMTVDTVFDMASITKPVATATSIMKLVEQGKLAVEDPVVKYIPEFGAHDKDAVTIADLLTHQSGLLPDNAIADFTDGHDRAFECICDLSLREPLGTKFIYSDVGFMVLGEIVQRVSGESVHEFSRREVFQPLGMTETGFLPDEPLRARAAPTEQRDGDWMRGEVHDPRAYLLGGIAGHAGLFSTAENLAVYAQMILNQGEYNGVRVLTAETVATMLTPRDVPGDMRRAYGWDVQSRYSNNRGEGLSSQAIGHGGFTGTVLWIDPDLELFYIFLSNRLHPDGKGTVNPLAGRIGSVVVKAVLSE